MVFLYYSNFVICVSENSMLTAYNRNAFSFHIVGIPSNLLLKDSEAQLDPRASTSLNESMKF